MCELPRESKTVTEVANVPAAVPTTAAAFRFISKDILWVGTGGCTVPTGTVMLLGGALVLRTPLTMVQPSTDSPVVVIRFPSLSTRKFPPRVYWVPLSEL